MLPKTSLHLQSPSPEDVKPIDTCVSRRAVVQPGSVVLDPQWSTALHGLHQTTTLVITLAPVDGFHLLRRAVVQPGSAVPGAARGSPGLRKDAMGGAEQAGDHQVGGCPCLSTPLGLRP